jgi:imidazolonepropionase-like amidohydrolase
MIALLIGAAHAACTVIAGSTVHTPDGPKEGQSVVLVDDRIAGVGVGMVDLKLSLGSDQTVTGASWKGANCEFVQGGGHHLTPGLIAVGTQIGLVEIGLEDGANDSDPHTSDPVRAALRVADAYDPRSVVVPVNRIHGVSHAVVIPGGGGIVKGQLATVRLRGDSQQAAVVDASVAMSGWVGTNSWAEGLRQLRELFADVRAVAADPVAYRQGRMRPVFEGASALDLEALVPVVRGEQPLLITADRASEIEALLRMADEEGLKLILAGGAEGWLVADQLAEAGVPVIVDSMSRRANGFDKRWGTWHNAQRLVEAGVDVMYTANFATHNAYLVRHHAGNAVRAGVPHEQAVRSLTEVPARVFGLEEHGRIEMGAMADAVLWTGDPLEVTTLPAAVWIEGERVEPVSRQTLLRDRHMERLGLGAP